MSIPFLCKPINPDPILTNYLLNELLPGEPPCPCPTITTGPGTRQLGAVHTPQSPLKLFKPADPKSSYTASHIPSHRKHNETFVQVFPCSLCLLPTLVLAVWLHALSCILFLGIRDYNPLLSQQSFPCLCVSSYLVKTYPGYSLT